MANLVLKNDVDALTSVFQPIRMDYEWEHPSCLVYDASGFLGIRVHVSFLSIVPIGEFVQILNGSYKGTYIVTSLSNDATYVYIVTDGTFNGSDSTSNLFNVDKRQTFELFAGYQSGAGATVKPYQKIADIAVSINPITALFEVDLQSYLRTYFKINAPQSGIDYGLSLQWELFVTTDDVPTSQTINWSLTQNDSVNMGLNIKVDSQDEVSQLANSSGSFSANSSQTIQALGIRTISASGTVTLTVVNDTSATTIYTQQVTTDSNDIPSFSFTVASGNDYTITLTTNA